MAYTFPTQDVKFEAREFCTPRHDTYPSISPLTASNHTNRTILITGASKGIGRATAISYAQAGASQIAVAARSDLTSLRSELLSAALTANKPPPEILLLHLDQRDRASVADVAARVDKEFGRLDVLINCAGYLETFRPIAESDEDEYWWTWEVNYRGVYWVTKALLPLLIKSADGLQTIVNVGSIGGVNMKTGASGYGVSKTALMRFSEYVCFEYAKDGVLAFTVHPGGVLTELARKMPDELHGLLNDTPEMAADAMVFLTQEKRTWLAGRYISCNWDMPEFLSKKDEIVAGDKLKMRLVL